MEDNSNRLLKDYLKLEKKLKEIYRKGENGELDEPEITSKKPYWIIPRQRTIIFLNTSMMDF